MAKMRFVVVDLFDSEEQPVQPGDFVRVWFQSGRVPGEAIVEIHEVKVTVNGILPFNKNWIRIEKVEGRPEKPFVSRAERLPDDEVAKGYALRGEVYRAVPKVYEADVEELTGIMIPVVNGK